MSDEKNIFVSTFTKHRSLFLLGLICLLAVGVYVLTSQNLFSFGTSRTHTNVASVASSETTLSSGEVVESTLDVSPITPEEFTAILAKIRETPQNQIKATIDSNVSFTTFYYSVAPDPYREGSADGFVFEIETETYLDENGAEFPGGPKYTTVEMRDSDLDALPELYWKDEFGADLAYRTLSTDMPDRMYYSTMWNVGLAYFRTNILNVSE